MDGACLFHPESNPNSVGEFKGALPNGGMIQSLAMPLDRSTVRRKRLSDITNLTSNAALQRFSAGGSEIEKYVPAASTKNYIAQLVKENFALLRLLEERNKMYVLRGTELQKLKQSLQKANLQNWTLAQAHSQMLAEYNLGKDKLKGLQHELGCTTAVLKAKIIELEEVKKLNRKQQKQRHRKIGTENSQLKEWKCKLAEATVDASNPLSNQKACDPNEKRALISRSLGSAMAAHQIATKEKDASRRSLRRRSSNLKADLCEPKEELFEIEDLKLPIRSLTGDPMNEDSTVQPDCSSSQHLPDSKLNPLRVAILEHCGSPEDQNQVPRRSSIGRPLRRAAEKINSYKELPLNIKIRRKE